MGAVLVGLHSVAMAEPARQEGFFVDTAHNGYYFKYAWKDSRSQSHDTVFGVHTHDIQRGGTEFQKPNLNETSIVLPKLRPAAEQLAKSLGYDVDLKENSSGFDVHLKGHGLTQRKAQSVTSQITTLRDRILAEHFKEKFYTVVEKQSEKYLRPDYLALTDRYTPFGAVVARALDKTSPKDRRGKARHALEFIQSIPYSRDTPNGADFQTPIGMFTQNQGDCDTKSVALAAILREYGIDSVMVVIPEHMFMGVEVTPLPGDHTFSHGGKTFVGLEPAGEGYPIGQVGPDSLSGLHNGGAEVIDM
jgi:hypothetical protein